MWQNNLGVQMTFGSHHSQNCWVLLAGVGWKKIKPNATDGVTNLYIMMNTAKANNRPVNVFLDADEITIAYLT